MATTTAYVCDACKRVLQPTEGIRIEGKVFQINNRLDEILVKIRGGKELDLCPVCFWKAMTRRFKQETIDEINKTEI